MLGYFIGDICKYRFQVSIQNLSRSFPHLSYRDIHLLRRRFYKNLGRILYENIRPHVVQLSLTDTAFSTIHRLNQEQRQVILLLGHYGNWEVLNKLPQHVDGPVQALYKPLRSSIFNYLSYKKRTKYGVRLIPASRALRVLIKEKDRPSITFFIADQFPGHQNGVAVKFLQQDTFMFSGAEQLAKRINAFVGYVELTTTSKNKWKVHIEPICEYAEQTENGEITKKFSGMLEETIQRDPTWWLWTHRRWK